MMINSKRKRDVLEDSVSETDIEQPAKRTTVTMPTLNPSGQDLRDQLEQLGTNIALVADSADAVDRRFIEIQNELLDAFRLAVDHSKQQLVSRMEQEQEQEQEERLSMQHAEAVQSSDLKERFFQDLRGITDRMSTELTIGQQAKMFEYMTTTMNTILNEESASQDASSHPNQTSRLAEIASILYNYSLTHLTDTLSNIYETSPAKITQLVSIIAASGMAYTYLPDGPRSLFESLSYFGPMFQIMNRANPQIMLVQNSAATVTTTYYLLKNAGFNTDAAISGLAEFTKSAAKACTKTAGAYACSSAAATLSSLQTGAQSLMSSIANGLGDILTSDYLQEDSLLSNSQSSNSSTSSSFSSSRTVDSSASQKSHKSVESLFSLPVESGGIELNGANIPSAVVEERFNYIVNMHENNTTEMASSQDSTISDLSVYTTDSENYGTWLFPTAMSKGGKQRRRRTAYRKRNTHKKRKTYRKRKTHKISKRKNKTKKYKR